MTELVTAHSKRQALPGPRQLNPRRDLPGVANLIEQAFADDLDQEGRQVLKELRRLGRWGTLTWLMRYIMPTLEDVLSGFVWEQDGQIVGNVSVSVMNSLAARWRISNVAVASPYRGQGIARRLMECTINHVERRGGRAIYLQVREDNVPAVRLYRGLNFRPITAETEMYLRRVVQPDVADSARVRLPRHDEGPELYALALAATPQAEQQLAPLSQIDFAVDWLQKLSDLLTAWASGQRVYRFVMDGKRGLAGYAKLTTAHKRGNPHRFSLLVHPDYAGQVETELILAVLRTLHAHYADDDVQIRLNAEKKAEIAALTALGFVKHRTLVLMELQLPN